MQLDLKGLRPEVLLLLKGLLLGLLLLFLPAVLYRQPLGYIDPTCLPPAIKYVLLSVLLNEIVEGHSVEGTNMRIDRTGKYISIP